MSGNICRCARLSQHRRGHQGRGGSGADEGLHLRAPRHASAEAAKAVAAKPGAKFIAGGTNLLDLMKLEVETPTHLVDVNRLPLDKIEPTRRRAACASARWCATAISRPTRGCARTTRC